MVPTGATQLTNNLNQNLQTAQANAASNVTTIDQIQLSPQAQAMLAANNTATAGAAAAPPSTNSQSATSIQQNFLNFAKMSPAQKMYAQILQSMGLTPQQLAAMPPAQQKAIQNNIAQMIKEKMSAGTGVQTGVSAGTANTSIVAAAGTN